MIDEELYQQAADELNSDRRRAHIWARACALASDDHDEARYLYTNLRVEELIEERQASGAVANVDDDIDSDSEDHDTTLALEPIDLELDPDQEELEASNDSADVFQLNDTGDIPEMASTPAGVDHLKNPDDYLQLDAAGEEDSDALQSVRRIDFDEELPSSVDLVEEHANLGNVPESRIEQEFYARNKDLQSSPSVENDLSDTFDDTADFDGTAVIDFDTEEMALFQESLVEEGDPLAPPHVVEDSSPGIELELKPDDDASQYSNELLENDLGDDLGDDLGVNLGSNVNLGERLDSNLSDDLDELLDNVSEVSGNGSDNAEVGLTGDFSAASGTQAINIDDEFNWLEDDSEQQSTQSQLQSYSPPESPSAEDLAAQRFTQELERQAEELPGQYSDVVAFSEVTENHQSTTEGSQSSDTGTNIAQEDDSRVAAATGVAAAAFTATSSSTQQSQHYSPPNDLVLELPIDLSDELSGTRYAVYRRDSHVQAVKTGVSWSALIMTLPFLIYRHLFGTAIVYIALALIVKVGLLISGLAWLDAGASASTLIKACTAGFALLAVLGLLYLPFRYANSWRSNKLENRGFELVAWVRAKNPGKAIMEARRATALD